MKSVIQYKGNEYRLQYTSWIGKYDKFGFPEIQNDDVIIVSDSGNIYYGSKSKEDLVKFVKGLNVHNSNDKEIFYTKCGIYSKFVKESVISKKESYTAQTSKVYFFIKVNRPENMYEYMKSTGNLFGADEDYFITFKEWVKNNRYYPKGNFDFVIQVPSIVIGKYVREYSDRIWNSIYDNDFEPIELCWGVLSMNGKMDFDESAEIKFIAKGHTYLKGDDKVVIKDIKDGKCEYTLNGEKKSDEVKSLIGKLNKQGYKLHGEKKSEEIEITKDVRIPGTNIILEKGDKVVVHSMKESSIDDIKRKEGEEWGVTISSKNAVYNFPGEMGCTWKTDDVKLYLFNGDGRTYSSFLLKNCTILKDDSAFWGLKYDDGFCKGGITIEKPY